MKNLLLYIRTLRHLTTTQIFFRIFYSIRNKLTSPLFEILKNSKHQFPTWNKIKFQVLITNHTSFTTPQTFTFLNQTHPFKTKINWNYSGHKKLWTYNLNYFDFLLQESITKEEGLQLINQYIYDYNQVKDGKEPYPTSIRIINWVKFCLIHEIVDQTINTALCNQNKRLSKNLEYNLLGNHLLENAMALCAGAVFVGDSKLFQKGKKLLDRQIKEQILPDGAHYERSPMYHNILLGRLLDTIQILNHFSVDKHWILELSHTASAMLGWAETIAFTSSALPLMKDAAHGIAPDLSSLLKAAASLRLEPKRTLLKESGYRKMSIGHFDLLVDIGNITPSYQPGHAHADTFNFELYVSGKPFIVDTGTSTYNPGTRRAIERGTAAHNTVIYAGQNSSEVWASHRVGRRAKVTVHADEADKFIASHNGYSRLGVKHKRFFLHENKSLLIVDDILPLGKTLSASRNSISSFHFHPDRVVIISDNALTIDNKIHISFNGFKSINLTHFDYAPEFNKLHPSKVCEIEFENNLTTEIKEIPTP